MLKIRRPLGRLIFNMGIAIPGKTVFLIETAPCSAWSHYLNHCRSTVNWTLRNKLREIWKKKYETFHINKANLRDLIAATDLVILLKLDSNRQFFSPCDLEIWWMTPKNNRAPLLCYFKLFASFRSHWWIQTGVSVWKRLIWVKIDDFFLAVWPCSLTDDLEKQ